MSNLLPKERIDRVLVEYRSRLVLTGALVFLCVAIVAGIALLPAFVALKVEEASQAKQRDSNASQFDSNPISKAERADILRSQALLARVASVVSATSSPTEILSAALALRPAVVTVDHISFSPGKGGVIKINGEAKGREEINQYRDALAKEGRFNGVSIPVGALVGSEGGDFTITLSGDF